MDKITILNKKFQLFIPSAEIDEIVLDLANRINHDYKNKKIILLGILDGVFIFAADLSRQLNLSVTVSFLKVSTYIGMKSAGVLQQPIHPQVDIQDKHVLILEDIVDTGFTLHETIQALGEHRPADIKTATLLHKPGSSRKELKIDYAGKEIPDTFVVGYGMDYNGHGRHYKNIYSLI